MERIACFDTLYVLKLPIGASLRLSLAEGKGRPTIAAHSDFNPGTETEMRLQGKGEGMAVPKRESVGREVLVNILSRKKKQRFRAD